MTRFATAQDFREHVLKTASTLPNQQRAVADYLINHLRGFPFLALPELADLTKVSEPTIVRFAQSIGFGGFRELKMELLQLPAQPDNGLETDAAPSDDPNNVLHSVASLETNNILETVKILDTPTFDLVAKALHDADHTYVFGMGVSAVLAVMTRYVFTEVGVPCTVLSTDFTSPMEQLAALRPADFVLAFSLPPYSRQTLDVLRGAGERGAATAVITDGLGSPACPLANWVLTVRTDNMMFTNAVAAVIVLINAIATQYAVRHRGRSLEALAHTAKAMTNNADVVVPERMSEK